MLKITGDNYHEYKQISEIIWQFEANLWKIDPDDKNSPVNVLNEWEKKSKSLAKKGLKAGLSDMLAMSIDMSIDTKNSLNEQLISRGFPGLNELVSTIKDTIPTVLKRGKIKNLDEYYIVKELLINLTYCFGNTDKEQIEQIIDNFEISYGKKNDG